MKCLTVVIDSLRFGNILRRDEEDYLTLPKHMYLNDVLMDVFARE